MVSDASRWGSVGFYVRHGRRLLRRRVLMEDLERPLAGGCAHGGEGAAATPPTPAAPQLLWGAFFELPLRSCAPAQYSAQLPVNLVRVEDAGLSLHCDVAVRIALPQPRRQPRL